MPAPSGGRGGGRGGSGRGAKARGANPGRGRGRGRGRPPNVSAGTSAPSKGNPNMMKLPMQNSAIYMGKKQGK